VTTHDLRSGKGRTRFVRVCKENGRASIRRCEIAQDKAGVERRPPRIPQRSGVRYRSKNECPMFVHFRERNMSFQCLTQTGVFVQMSVQVRNEFQALIHCAVVPNADAMLEQVSLGLLV